MDPKSCVCSALFRCRVVRLAWCPARSPGPGPWSAHPQRSRRRAGVINQRSLQRAPPSILGVHSSEKPARRSAECPWNARRVTWSAPRQPGKEFRRPGAFSERPAEFPWSHHPPPETPARVPPSIPGVPNLREFHGERGIRNHLVMIEANNSAFGSVGITAKHFGSQV